MQKSDTLAQIQTSINYVMEQLTLPDYINPEDVEQQTALVHLELLASGKDYETMDQFHKEILISIRNWLAPVILNHADKIPLKECKDMASRKAMLEDMVATRDALDQAIKELSPRRKYVVEARYGLRCTEKDHRTIGEELGLSKSRVEDIERDALDKMRFCLGTT